MHVMSSMRKLAKIIKFTKTLERYGWYILNVDINRSTHRGYFSIIRDPTNKKDRSQLQAYQAPFCDNGFHLHDLNLNVQFKVKNWHVNDSAWYPLKTMRSHQACQWILFPFPPFCIVYNFANALREQKYPLFKITPFSLTLLSKWYIFYIFIENEWYFDIY